MNKNISEMNFDELEILIVGLMGKLIVEHQLSIQEFEFLSMALLSQNTILKEWCEFQQIGMPEE